MQKRWYSGSELMGLFDLKPIEWDEAVRGKLPPYTKAGRCVGFKDSHAYGGNPKQRKLADLQWELEGLEQGDRVKALTGPDAGQDVTAKTIGSIRTQIENLQKRGVTPPNPPSPNVEWIDLAGPDESQFVEDFGQLHFKADDVLAFAQEMNMSGIASKIQANAKGHGSSTFLEEVQEAIQRVKTGGQDNCRTHSTSPKPNEVNTTESDWLFKEAGEFWKVRVGGKPIKHIPNLKGMKYIRHLLENPGKSFSALELEGKPDAPTTHENVLDKKARQQHLNAIEKLEDIRDQAQKDNDQEQKKEATEQLNSLWRIISQEYGIQNKDQLRRGKTDQTLKQTDQAEKARKRVCKNFNTVMKKISSPDNQFFLSHIKLGTTFLYEPPSDPPEWDL